MILGYAPHNPLAGRPIENISPKTPSLGRAIADVLPKPHRKGDGCIHVCNGDCVSWCVGHLLEQAEPDAYDPQFNQWRLEHLPIIPEEWKLKPKAGTGKQLTVLRKLVKEADQLIHAGDPDREGQLLVDQVIDYLKVRGPKRDSIQRCLINDLNPAAVIKALGQLRDNKAFVPKPFYEVIAHLVTEQGEHFRARWQPSEACLPYQDDEGRVLSKVLAEKVQSRIHQQPATVTASSAKTKKQPPPMPYNLSALQIDAARRFGMSAKQVLDTAQALYERHKLITYPRSDSRHLPTGHFADRHSVIDALVNNCPPLGEAAHNADRNLKSGAWNDSKVDAHHAIIPTARKMDTNILSQPERNVYELVARQYLAQFYPAHEYSDSQIDLDIAGGRFIAKARVTLKPGWKALFPARTGGDKGESALNTSLPALTKGDTCLCEKGEVLEKQTTLPKPFDDASLLAAMTGIARYVQDPELRKILKDTDGLGTEATRAGFPKSPLRRT